MTQRQMINRIAGATGLPKVRVGQVVAMLLEQLGDTLAQTGRLQLRDFGSFRTVELGARVGRNPRTGRPVRIRASRHVRFRAGKGLREKINR